MGQSDAASGRGGRRETHLGTANRSIRPKMFARANTEHMTPNIKPFFYDAYHNVRLFYIKQYRPRFFLSNVESLSVSLSALLIPINSTTGQVDGSSERAAIRARELKLRAACEDGDFEQYKELAIETWPMVVGGVSKETKHCADLAECP